MGVLMLRDIGSHVEGLKGTRTRVESGSDQHKLACRTKVLPLRAGPPSQAGSCEYGTGLV
jgi:hypothetical protein